MHDLYQRPRSPFDDSVLERLRRMGLADADGRADPDVMIVFARIFAGQFYDDLCDYHQDYADVQELLAQLLDAAENAEPKQKFLLRHLTNFASVPRSTQPFAVLFPDLISHAYFRLPL